jgi:hypothetical protein
MPTASPVSFILTVGLTFAALHAFGAETISTETPQPLADVIAAFNQHAADIEIGKEQPAITLDEVLAAIRFYQPEKSKPLSAEVLTAFKAIAETRELPPGASIWEMTRYEPDGPFSFDVWWVRLYVKDSKGDAHALPIRERMIRSHSEVPREEAFGPADDHGLRLACALIPQQEEYAFDEVVDRRIFIRNDGPKPIDFTPPETGEGETWAVVDDAGKSIPIKTFVWEMPHLHVMSPVIHLLPGQTQKLSAGHTVGLGHGAPVDHPGCTIVRADMGQSCHVTWTLDLSVAGESVHLKSGEVHFRIRNPGVR